MALCINGRYQEAFYVIAVVCSTWSSMNAHTSQRDVLTPYGNTALSGVRAANRMVARWGMETMFTIKYCLLMGHLMLLIHKFINDTL